MSKVDLNYILVIVGCLTCFVIGAGLMQLKHNLNNPEYLEREVYTQDNILYLTLEDNEVWQVWSEHHGIIAYGEDYWELSLLVDDLTAIPTSEHDFYMWDVWFPKHREE